MADTPINVPVGALTLTGFPPSIEIEVPTGVLTLTGFVPSIKYSIPLADTLQQLDNPQVGWSFFIDESLNLSETFIIDWIITTVDEMFLSENIVLQGNYQTLLSELLQVFDTAQAIEIFLEVIAESYNLSDNLIDLHKKLVIVAELFKLQETLLNLGSFQQLLAEGLNLSESLEKLFAELVGETFQLSEVVGETGIFLTAINEAFNISELLAEIFTASMTVTETLQGTDSAGNQVTFYILNNDQVVFRSEIILSGQAFACWVLTTKDYNPSIYSNFDFNSYGKIEDKLYGAREDGIYLLEGADDAGSDVHTGLLFDFANMDIPATKRLRTVHLGSKTSEGTVQVATDRGIEKSYRSTNQRAVIGKEVRGKFWTVAVENFDDLKSMELNVVLISKKQ